MTSEIQSYNFNGASLRTLTDEAGEPWFVAKDACDILGIDTIHLRGALDDDEITNLRNSEVWNQPGRAPLIVSEPGLYKLIMRSRKPEAKEFQRWVTHEVLPQIRKTGGYIPTSESDSDEDIMARAVLVAQKTIERKNQQLQAKDTHQDVGAEGPVRGRRGRVRRHVPGRRAREDAPAERDGHRPEQTVPSSSG